MEKTRDASKTGVKGNFSLFLPDQRVNKTVGQAAAGSIIPLPTPLWKHKNKHIFITSSPILLP